MDDRITLIKGDDFKVDNCEITGDKIKDNELSLFINGLSIHINNITKFIDLIRNKLLKKEKNYKVNKKGEKYVEYEIINSVKGYQNCIWCDKKRSNQKSIKIDWVNEFMNWYEKSAILHTDCAKDLIEIIEENKNILILKSI